MAFNIRVYGLLVNKKNDLLLSDERRFGKQFTKLPGGGLEQGEGMKECLIREFKEELNIDIQVGELFYLTDFYQQSAFHKDDQIISVYYWVLFDNWKSIPTRETPFDFIGDEIEAHRWKSIPELKINDVTFPIDKKVVEQLKA